MDLGLNRRNLGRLILLAWAVALAWLARRQFTGSDASTVAAGTRRLQPGAAHYRVLARGRQVGQLNISVDTLVDGVRISELFVLDLPVGDSTRQLASGTDAFLTRSLRLQTFTLTVFGRGNADRLDGTVGPDSLVGVRASDGSRVTTGTARYRAPAGAVLPAALPFRVAFSGRLSPGSRILVPVLDPASGVMHPVEVLVEAESTFVVPDSAAFDTVSGRWTAVSADTVPAWRLRHTVRGAPAVTWVDAGGTTVLAEYANGIRLERAAFEDMRNNYLATLAREPQGWRAELPGMRGLAGSGRVPDTVAAFREFVVEGDSASGVRGLPAAAAGGRQSLRGDTIRVIRHTAPDSVAPGPDDLSPTADLPIRDAELGRVAVAAMGEAAEVRERMRRLTRWVAREIATDTTLASGGSARLALATRRGTTDAKARLLVAMARASGIPARVANGIAVLPQGSFAHSWAEFWDGGWIAADPAFGHFPASASLVRLATGGRSRPVDLVPLAGSARFLPLRPPR